MCWSYELQRLRGPDSFDSTLSLYRCIEICDNRKDIRLVRYNNVYDGERFVTWSGICDMRVPKTEQDQHKAARGSASIFISPTGELQITPPVSEPQMQREPDRARSSDGVRRVVRKLQHCRTSVMMELGIWDPMVCSATAPQFAKTNPG